MRGRKKKKRRGKQRGGEEGGGEKRERKKKKRRGKKKKRGGGEETGKKRGEDGGKRGREMRQRTHNGELRFINFLRTFHTRPRPAYLLRCRGYFCTNKQHIIIGGKSVIQQLLRMLPGSCHTGC